MWLKNMNIQVTYVLLAGFLIVSNLELDLKITAIENHTLRLYLESLAPQSFQVIKLGLRGFCGC